MITDDDLIAALNKDAKGADARQHILMLHQWGSTADEMARQLHRIRIGEKEKPGGAFKGLSLGKREKACRDERVKAMADVKSMLVLAQKEHEERLEAAEKAGDRPAEKEPAGAHADGEQSMCSISKIG